MEKRLVYVSRLLLILYIAAVCFLCFMHFSSGIDMNKELLGIPTDKIVHFLMFLPFPVLMYMAFHVRKGKPSGLILFLVMVIVAGAAGGALIELGQQWTGYRSCDPLDFRADCIGLLTGAVITVMYGAISRKW